MIAKAEMTVVMVLKVFIWKVLEELVMVSP